MPRRNRNPTTNNQDARDRQLRELLKELQPKPQNDTFTRSFRQKRANRRGNGRQ
jgi:hypothetical protein